MFLCIYFNLMTTTSLLYAIGNSKCPISPHRFGGQRFNWYLLFVRSSTPNPFADAPINEWVTQRNVGPKPSRNCRLVKGILDSRKEGIFSCNGDRDYISRIHIVNKSRILSCGWSRALTIGKKAFCVENNFFVKCWSLCETVLFCVDLYICAWNSVNCCALHLNLSLSFTMPLYLRTKLKCCSCASLSYSLYCLQNIECWF